MGISLDEAAELAWLSAIDQLGRPFDCDWLDTDETTDGLLDAAE